jgi:hypothetical protein
MKVINEDGASITTEVAIKQLCYIPITQSLKRLFLCEETVQLMRWYKEGIRMLRMLRAEAPRMDGM